MMKRTKKRDAILLNYTVERALNSIDKECGALSYLTTKLLIKKLQANLKTKNLAPVPTWYMGSSIYDQCGYSSEHEEIITKEEFRLFQAKQEKS